MNKMKKITKLFSLTSVALFAIMFLTACGNNHELVDTWIWEMNTEWSITFNDDGTGTRGGGADPVSDFEWSIYEGEDSDREELHIECPIAMFGVYTEIWHYAIESDVLILDSLQGGGQGLRYDRE